MVRPISSKAALRDIIYIQSTAWNRQGVFRLDISSALSKEREAIEAELEEFFYREMSGSLDDPLVHDIIGSIKEFTMRDATRVRAILAVMGYRAAGGKDIEKARKAAQQNMINIKLTGTTIPHRVMAKYRASKVVLLPAGQGTGVIAGASVRAVMELAGIKDVLTKVYGSTGPKNLVKAAFKGLASLRSKDEVAKLRGVSLA